MIAVNSLVPHNEFAAGEDPQPGRMDAPRVACPFLRDYLSRHLNRELDGTKATDLHLETRTVPGP